MSEPEPLEIMREAAMTVLANAGRDLRERGWPVELIVDPVPERDTYAVSLRIELPSMPVPLEAMRLQSEAEAGGEV